jgi:anaerobic selenocysteine-containing dehydrogenase
MIHLGHALAATDPLVKALIVYNANPVSVAPDGSSVREGLCREDLFTVVHEQIMSPTARFADILLPATTFLENRDCYSSYGHFYFGLAEPVIEPIGEAKSNFDFFQMLAEKMGFTDVPFRQSVDERINSYLDTLSGVPDNFRWQELQGGTYVESIYNKQAGSVLKRKNSRFRFANSDDPTLPRFACITEAAEFDHPDLLTRFPYKLITPPNSMLLNSTFGERFDKEPGSVLVHPDDAATHGIQKGSMVELLNFRGKVLRRAVITDATQKGLLVAEGIYWPTAGSGAAINDLTSQQCSDIGGGALFHETRVRLAVVPKLKQQQ